MRDFVCDISDISIHASIVLGFFFHLRFVSLRSGTTFLGRARHAPRNAA